jgi:hypothetical protein
MAIYKNTTDTDFVTVTDISLLDENDYTLSNIDGGEYFYTYSDGNAQYSIVNSITYDGWNFGTNSNVNNINWEKVDATFKVFHDIDDLSDIEQSFDPDNHLQTIISTSLTPAEIGGDPGGETLNTIVDRGYKAKHNGLYSFNINAKGYATLPNKDDKKGGLLTYQLCHYSSGSRYNKKVVFETDPKRLAYSGSQYNYTLISVNPTSSINYIDVSTDGLSGYNTNGALLPFNTITKNEGNLSTSITSNFTEHLSEHITCDIPFSGDYNFKAKISGSVEMGISVTTPNGYSGSFTIPDRNVVLQVKLFKNNQLLYTVPNSYTVNVGGSVFEETDSGAGTDTLTSASIFFPIDIPEISIDNQTLALDDKITARISVNNINGYGTQNVSETIGSDSGFVIGYTVEGFRVHNNSNFRLVNYSESGTKGHIAFSINASNIEIPLGKGDSIALHGRIKGVEEPDSPSNLKPYNTRPKTQVRGLFIEDITTYASTGDNSIFTCDKVILSQEKDNIQQYSSGQYSSQPNAYGRNAYQPVEGSFLVDLSEITASAENPILVQIPLHGYTKHTQLKNGMADSHHGANSRKTLNHSVEINLSTVSNTAHSPFGPITDSLPTHQVIEANFMHWGKNNLAITHHSHTVARFDDIGMGTSNEDVVSQYPFFPNDTDVFQNDNSNASVGEGRNGILQEGWIEGLPLNAMVNPQVVMIPGAFTSWTQIDGTGVDQTNPLFIEAFTDAYSPLQQLDNQFLGEVLVSPSTKFHPTTVQFFQSIDYRGQDPSAIPSYPGIASWYKMYDLYKSMYHTGSDEEKNKVFSRHIPEGSDFYAPGTMRRTYNLEAAFNTNQTYGHNFAHGKNKIPSASYTFYDIDGYPTVTEVEPTFYGENYPTSLPIYFDNVIIDNAKYGQSNPYRKNWHQDYFSPGQSYWETIPPSASYVGPSNPPVTGPLYDPDGDGIVNTFEGSYGNLRGRGDGFGDKLGSIYNYYEAPHDGLYTVTYNVNLIVEAAGGYASAVGEGTGNSGGNVNRDHIHRFLTFNPETYFGAGTGDGLAAPLSWIQHYDGPQPHNEANVLRYAFASNTLYGRLMKTNGFWGHDFENPNRDYPGEAVVVATSSLFRCDDYVDTQFHPAWTVLFGKPIGYSFFYWTDPSSGRPPGGTTVTVAYISEVEEMILNTWILRNTTWANPTSPLYNYQSPEDFFHPGGVTWSPTDIPDPGDWDYQYEFGEGTPPEDYLQDLGFGQEYNITYANGGTFTINTACNEIYYQNTMGMNNAVEVDGSTIGYNSGYDAIRLEPGSTIMTYSGLGQGPVYYTVDFLANNIYFQNFLQAELIKYGEDWMAEAAWNWLSGQNPGLFSMGQNNAYPSHNEGVANTGFDVVQLGMDGDVNDLLNALDGFTPTYTPDIVGSTPGVIEVDLPQATTDIINEAINILNSEAYQQDSIKVTFNTERNTVMAPVPDTFATPWNNSIQITQTNPDRFFPQRVVMPVSDKKLVFMRKGERLHFEVGLGPILPRGSYNWKDTHNPDAWNVDYSNEPTIPLDENGFWSGSMQWSTYSGGGGENLKVT